MATSERIRSMTLFSATATCLALVVSLPLPAGAQQVGDGGSAERWRADVRYLAEELPKRHKNLFATMPREEFDRTIRALGERMASLTPQEAFVEVARIVARVRDGHTRVTKNDPNGLVLRQYPLALYLYRDGLFVQAAAPEYAAAIGGRVVKIGTATADHAIRAARELVTHDNEMTIRARLPAVLTSPEALRGLHIVEDMERAPFVVERGGERITVGVKPVALGPRDTWVDARDQSTGPAPLWLKDPSNRYWFEYLDDSRTLYVQYNAVSDKRDESVATFFARVFATAEQKPVDRFVLDIRNNGGGSNMLNLPIVHGLIRSEKLNQRGKLFVVLGRRTFSAAVSLAADLERHTQAIFVGEPTGGTPNHFGSIAESDEPTSITLPNSRLTITYSNEFIQRSYPGDTRQWIAPSIAAELTSEAYRSGVDPAMTAILAYTPRPPLSDTMTEAALGSGVDAALDRYRAFKADPANAYVDVEWEVHLVGRRLLFRDRTDDALRVFTFNAVENPESFKALDDLGEIYTKMGKTEPALRSYRRSIELNPRNWKTVERLKRLTVASAP